MHLLCLPCDAAARRSCDLAKKLGLSWPQSPPPYNGGKQGPSPGQQRWETREGWARRTMPGAQQALRCWGLCFPEACRA